ncbi:MAG: PP2C family protein-serine/threonine phosphatase, partial [Actinomycetota bacterium]
MRLSLRQKLVGGFGLLLVLIVLLGWVTLSLFGSLRNVQRRVFDTALPELVAVDEIIRSFTAQSAAIRGYLISSSPTLLEQYRTETEVATEWEEVAFSLEPTRRERDLLNRLVDAGDSFQDLVDDEVVPLAEQGSRSQAFRVLSQDGEPLIAEVELLGEQLRLEQDRVVARTERELESLQDQTVITLVAVLVGAFAIGLALAIYLPRRLTSSIGQLVRAARGIERGDFNQTIDIRSGDEVEELAKRFEEMQRGLARLQQLALQERELEIAASIQRNLLQRTVPEPPGVKVTPLQRQANRVGGDWYDFELGGRALSVVIGDASGKGIAAALMATVTLSSLRAERSLGAGPKRVIERANRALRDATEEGSFASVIYLILDIETGAIRWFNMGHHSPFRLRAKDTGGGHFLEGPRNKPLGWYEDTGLSEGEARLEPGDRLVLYTDGFLEARDPDGELFGEDRLADSLVRLAPLDAANLGE